MTTAPADLARKSRIEFDDGPVRQFMIASIVWGIVGMLVGVLIATQLAVWQVNFNTPWLTFGRLRPLHTNAIIFAFVGNMMFAGIYYSTQRLVKARTASRFLSQLHFWGWQAIIVAAAITLPLGLTRGKEYAELIWPINIAVAVIWVVFGINFFWTLARRNEPSLYVALWFYIATIITVAHGGESMAGDVASALRRCPAGCLRQAVSLRSAVWSLPMSDVHTHWTETRAVWNKGQHGVQTRIAEVEKALLARPPASLFPSASSALRHPRLRARPRRRVPQLAPGGLFFGAQRAGGLHPLAPLSQDRQRASGAEKMDARAATRRLRPAGRARTGRAAQRPLREGMEPVPQLLLSRDETPAHRSRRQPQEAHLRRAPAPPSSGSKPAGKPTPGRSQNSRRSKPRSIPSPPSGASKRSCAGCCVRPPGAVSKQSPERPGGKPASAKMALFQSPYGLHPEGHFRAKPLPPRCHE